MCAIAVALLILFGSHGLVGLLWVVVVTSLVQLVIRVREALFVTEALCR
jgi:hypothetical protein